MSDEKKISEVVQGLYNSTILDARKSDKIQDFKKVNHLNETMNLVRNNTPDKYFINGSIAIDSTGTTDTFMIKYAHLLDIIDAHTVAGGGEGSVRFLDLTGNKTFYRMRLGNFSLTAVNFLTGATTATFFAGAFFAGAFLATGFFLAAMVFPFMVYKLK